MCVGASLIYKDISGKGGKMRENLKRVSCNLCNAQSKTFTSNSDISNDWDSKACEKAVKAWNMEYEGDR